MKVFSEGILRQVLTAGEEEEQEVGAKNSGAEPRRGKQKPKKARPSGQTAPPFFVAWIAAASKLERTRSRRCSRDDAVMSSFPLATLAGRVSVFIRDEQERRKTNGSADA